MIPTCTGNERLIELSDDDRAELREIKQEQIRLLATKQKLILDNGLKYYDPHPKQDAFHRAGRFKRRAVFAGNRFGKSDCGAAEDSAQAVGARLWIPEGDPARYEGIPRRPQKILIVTTDWGKVDEIFTNERGADTGKLWKFLPRGFVVSKKRNHGSGAIETMECENGSLIQFDTVESFKKNPQGAESSNWDVIHIDEPCPEAMYSAHARGMVDRGGQAYFTLTPLKEPWIYDRFFGEDNIREAIELGRPRLYKNDNWSITGSIWDNPYLSEANIIRYLTEDCPEEERECREKGIPLQFAGLIYKEFESAVHTYRDVPIGWDDFDSPPKGWPVYLQLDPHSQTPCAGLLATVSPESRKFVYDEVWMRGIASAVVADMLRKIGGRQLINPQCDPSAFNEDALSGTCWADDFGALGLWFDRAPKQLDRGIKAVQAALLSRFIDGTPEWVFSPLLKRFVYEIKRWHWDKENKPKDKDDHTLECLYRMVLSKPEWVEPAGYYKQVDDLAIVNGLDSDERWERRELNTSNY